MTLNKPIYLRPPPLGDLNSWRGPLGKACMRISMQSFNKDCMG
jgi:hypothetical protein